MSVITRGQAKRLEHRPTVHDDTGVHVNGDETRDDTEVNLVNDVGLQTHTNTRSDSSTELMVSGDARRNGRRLQAINDVCVSVPEVCVSTSVRSDDNTRSVVLYDSNVMHGKPVWRKTKRSRKETNVCDERAYVAVGR